MLLQKKTSSCDDWLLINCERADYSSHACLYEMKMMPARGDQANTVAHRIKNFMLHKTRRRSAARLD